MFCMNCGKQLKDGSRFCPCCGTDLSIVAELNARESEATCYQPAPEATYYQPVHQPVPEATYYQAPVQQPAPEATYYQPLVQQPAPQPTLSNFIRAGPGMPTLSMAADT